MKDVVVPLLLALLPCLASSRKSKCRPLPGRRLAVALLVCVSQSLAWCQVPEFFGIYAVNEGKLAALIGGKGTFTPGQTSLQVYDFQKMSVQTENVFLFQGAELHFEVFDPAVADTSGGLELYRLPYARNLITRPDALAQVGGMLDQITGRARPGAQPQSASSPLQKYVVAKTDALKVELLQKPVPGQPQMIQLVPSSNLEPGIYCLFAIRNQGGQPMIVGRIFDWKGQSGTVAPRYCIDLAVTGGFGGIMDESDARMMRPYYLGKEKYVACSDATASAPRPTATPTRSLPGRGGTGPMVCRDYDSCFDAGVNAYQAEDWSSADAAFQAAAKLRPTSGEPWVWIGRIILQDGQQHTEQDLSNAWNKAFSLGAEVRIGGCHERTMRPCETGDLALAQKSVSFLVDGSRPVFAAAPGEVTPGRILVNGMHISYSIRVAGKNYALDFLPLGKTNCQTNLMIQCPEYGTCQRL